ncbi:MAG: hypothetical protein H0W76_06355 [Pyrinomonadaceae bacterium]|nr:hypothetical protein [Pyrinomonadaceae bacterium]
MKNFETCLTVMSGTKVKGSLKAHQVVPYPEQQESKQRISQFQKGNRYADTRSTMAIVDCPDISFEVKRKGEG